MTLEIDGELARAAQEIAAKRRYIEDQAALVDVLEHEGHDVLEQRKALAKERSDLAVRIAQQFRLLEEVASHEPSMQE